MEPWTSHCISGFCPTKCTPQIAPADGGYVAALVVDPPAFTQPMKAEWSTISMVRSSATNSIFPHWRHSPPNGHRYTWGGARALANVPPAASSLKSISYRELSATMMLWTLTLLVICLGTIPASVFFRLIQHKQLSEAAFALPASIGPCSGRPTGNSPKPNSSNDHQMADVLSSNVYAMLDDDNEDLQQLANTAKAAAPKVEAPKPVAAAPKPG